MLFRSVFQNYAIYPTMTVRQNVEFGLRNLKIPKAERKKIIEETAGKVGLSEYLDRKPNALSGGQRQRVALLRAMVKKPSVFLMDEPLSNLDAKLRVQMRRELIELHKKLATTFVYVTHSIRFENIPSMESQVEETSKIVKVKRFALRPMDPEEAVLQMELLGHNFFVFLEPDMTQFGIVYKRKDGNYGLLEPEI